MARLAWLARVACQLVASARRLLTTGRGKQVAVALAAGAKSAQIGRRPLPAKETTRPSFHSLSLSLVSSSKLLESNQQTSCRGLTDYLQAQQPAAAATKLQFNVARRQLAVRALTSNAKLAMASLPWSATALVTAKLLSRCG